MNITSAINPRTKDAKAYIDLDIMLEDGSVRPFTAMPNDPPGAELYGKAMKGMFGKVSIAPGDNYLWDGEGWASPSHETLIAMAELEKESRSSVVEGKILPLERAVKLDIATDDEKEKLKSWEVYSVLLSRVDTSTAPDIKWPMPPSEL